MQAAVASSSEPLTVRARDGARLAVDLVLPKSRATAAILIAPAMGVKRSFYGAFARFLADGGAIVMTLDYRGIGGSKDAATRKTRLHDWAELDLAGAIDHLRREYPKLPLRYFGHSVGGQLFGLLQDAPIERAMFAASQSGYWGHWDGVSRAIMSALWFAAVPTFVSALGKLPMKALGQGEDIPGGVGREWAEWGRQPRYIGTYADTRPKCFFSTYEGPLVAYAIEDDNYAPRRAVQGLLTEFRSTEGELRFVRPMDIGQASIGHFGALKKPGLWPSMQRFLLSE